MARQSDIRISKLLSFMLRHDPEAYGLTLDDFGFVAIDQVVAAIGTRYSGFGREDLVRIAESDPNGRYEIESDRIRACYGHSLSVSRRARTVEPPEELFHGTAGRNLNFILNQGLRAMRRQFVHLSVREADAIRVGRRHAKSVVLLKVRAREAYRAGVEFWCEGNTYLAAEIPPQFIEVIQPTG
jgi:putative RNA 2'-phosphotransferase